MGRTGIDHTKRRRAWLVTAGACALAVVAGVTVATNTNVLGPRDLCGGWFSGEDAGNSLDGFGRVTGSTDSLGGCTVEQSGWLPGTTDAKIRLSATSVTPAHPFGRSEWKASGAQNILPGELPGAFDTDGNGWVALPSDCGPIGAAWAKGDHTVLSVVTERGDADPAELARLTRATARKLAADHDCAPADSAAGNASADLIQASAPAKSDPATVCGLDGFSLGAKAPAASPLREQTSGSRDDAWFCDLSLHQPATGLPRDDDREPFARLAVIRNPELLLSAKERHFDHAVCGGKETYFATDIADYVYSPDTPEEKAAATLVKASDVQNRFTAAARTALACD
ncbi:hypothetical protein PV394_25555 [Streptomyces sp. NE06-03E]|uniref:hypothetical protein n=1 Tax=Streptomyces sp. NE06-03E TaxID=3028695 RepID=UPI0029A5C9F1|nr:hypothetical protein [Streptomyces sp. NE06-03E]MDX3058463.1 hypothetical protein [Streptomyces sp. NE06-03E]